MKNHILICGERGVGKTTLICRLLEATGLSVGGFCTKKDDESEEARQPVYIYPAGLPLAQRSRSAENLVGRCDDMGCQEVYPAVFDSLGALYLKNTLGAEVIVMDELGFMESTAQSFCESVLHTLDAEIPVLAAVKDRMDIAFLRQVCAHSGAEVVHITRENREELYGKLLPLVKTWKR